MTIALKRSLGALLLVMAALQIILVMMNDHARSVGGHDLRPMLGMALLFTVGGLGMLFQARWIKVSSSLIIAATGIWIIVRDTAWKGSNPIYLSIVFGLLLCVPAVFAFLGLRGKRDSNAY
jgi:hypothetical protein